MTSLLQEQAATFCQWCLEAALPYWAIKGLHPGGGFHERLLMDGSPDTSVPRRVRVTARMAYVYSHAAYLGWYDRAREVSDATFQFLRDVSGHPVTVDDIHIKQGCPHLLSQSGEIIDHGRDLYDQAFLLLACAWRIRAFNDPQAVKLAEDITARLDDGTAAVQPLFEAFIALFMATGDEIYRAKAHACYVLFHKQLYDVQPGLVREPAAGSRDQTGQGEESYRPGEALTWVSLLDRYAGICGDRDVPAKLPEQMAILFETAVRLGQNVHTGFVFERIAEDYTITDYDHSIPAQAAFIKACHVMGRRGAVEAYTLAGDLLARFIKVYLSVPAHGGWRDRCGVNGEPKGRYMEASTFYHLMSLSAVLDGYLKEQ